MKKLVYIISLLFPLCSLFGQERHVFTIKQQTDSQAGNFTSATATFTQRTMHFPVPENTPKGRYKIIASFDVNPDNTISNITILQDPGHGLGEACKKHLASISASDSLFIQRSGNNTGNRVRMNMPFYINVDQ